MTDPLHPMDEAPRDGRTIIARLKPARTPALESKRKTRDRRVGWRKNPPGMGHEGTWIDRSVAGHYWQDDAFEGWHDAG